MDDITITATSKSFSDVSFNLLNAQAQMLVNDLRVVRERLYGKDSDMPLSILISSGVSYYLKQIESLFPVPSPTADDEEPRHAFGCICADCSGAELTARND